MEQQSMNNTMNIFQRMAAATDEIGRVAKNLNIGFGKSQYKAVGEADVLAAVKPVEQKYGIYSYPTNHEIIEAARESVANADGGSKTSTFLRIKTVYRFVNIDKPEEYIETVTYGDGIDSADKAPGKATTYADKYALLKAYKIETGDDPDANAPAAEQYNILDRLGISVQSVAAYYKTTPDKLTREQVAKTIEQAQANAAKTNAAAANEPLITGEDKAAMLELLMDINKVAVAYRTTPDKLTHAQAQNAIARKKAALAKEAQPNV